MTRKHPREHNYEPTPARIKAECEKIRQHWTSEERTKRRVKLPLTRHWMPPTIYSLTNGDGEFYIVTSQEEAWWTDAKGKTVTLT